MNGTFHYAAESALLRQTATANSCVPNVGVQQRECSYCAYRDSCATAKAGYDCGPGRPAWEPLPIALLCADPDFEAVDGPLFRLMREIADEACRVDIECHARFVGDGASGPVYDTNQLEPGHIDDPEMVAADKRAIERAVQYLDMRGILHRPVAGYPSLVCFARV